MKYICTFSFAFFLQVLVSAQVITTTSISPPASLRCNEVPVKLNNVVFGAIPPNSQNGPVVVFIHGWFDNGYTWFMSKNKWYQECYNSGYKTAFFFHSFSDAFEDNGKVIAEMIRATCRHYNTNKVIAVCHSKGGFDIEYALYNENVWDSVQGVVTLSTPFWGAPLADLISNPQIRSTLEAIPIVGPVFQGKGTYQMQTAYMAGVVRPMMDNHPNNRPEKFHCFAAWGKSHRTVFPPNISDDILKVVFKDYQSLCVDIPGFGNTAGDLISGGMSTSGDISNFVQVQPQYNNPYNNQAYMDGLAPYYSSIRPGSIVISEPPPSQQSNLNHVDVLLSSNTWDIVHPEIEYFKNNPVFKSAPSIVFPSDMSASQTSSKMQMIQSKSFSIQTARQNKLILVGDYKNQLLKVLDERDVIVKEIPLNFYTKSFLDVFHEVDLSGLLPNKTYKIQSLFPLTAFLQDGNTSSIQLATRNDKTYYSDEPLGFELTVKDWSEDMNTASVSGILSRNINEKGEVIHGDIIPVSFIFDDVKQAFICKDKILLGEGVYNLSVSAEGKNLNRFATTSIYLKQERKSSERKGLIDVYPNPSSGLLSLKFNAISGNRYSVEFYDVQGKKMSSGFLGVNLSGYQQIDISDLVKQIPKGTAVVALIENGERKGAKVIVLN